MIGDFQFRLPFSFFSSLALFFPGGTGSAAGRLLLFSSYFFFTPTSIRSRYCIAAAMRLIGLGMFRSGIQRLSAQSPAVFSSTFSGRRVCSTFPLF